MTHESENLIAATIEESEEIRDPIAEVVPP